MSRGAIEVISYTVQISTLRARYKFLAKHLWRKRPRWPEAETKTYRRDKDKDRERTRDKDREKRRHRQRETETKTERTRDKGEDKGRRRLEMKEDQQSGSSGRWVSNIIIQKGKKTETWEEEKQEDNETD